MLATLLFRWWIIVNHKLCIVDLGVVIHISHYLVITPLMPHCARPQPCHQLRPLDLTGTHRTQQGTLVLQPASKGTNVAPHGCSGGKLERQRRKVRGQAHTVKEKPKAAAKRDQGRVGWILQRQKCQGPRRSTRLLQQWGLLLLLLQWTGKGPGWYKFAVGKKNQRKPTTNKW